MDNTKKPEQNTSGKKELRKQVADKIEAALPELKTTLGEKKFQHRIKKAVKHIMEGMHKKEKVTAAKKVKAAKKAVVKKTAPKKVATKKAAKSAKNAD